MQLSKSDSPLFFYVPFLYFIRTRISGIAKLISWSIIYIVPVFILGFYSSGFQFMDAVITCALAIILIYIFYEIGYIQNDLETTKKEIAPTLRLNEIQQQYYETNKLFIYSFRILCGVFVSYLIIYLNGIHQSVWFLISVYSLLLIYQVYNRIRSALTLLLHFILVSIRYYAVILLYPGVWSENGIIYLPLTYSFLNLLERSAGKKFNIKFIQPFLLERSKLAMSRFYYYLICTIILFLCYQNGKNEVLLSLFLCFYFMVYRLATIKLDSN